MIYTSSAPTARQRKRERAAVGTCIGKLLVSSIAYCSLFRAFGIRNNNFARSLGRWRRLSHFAPLALRPERRNSLQNRERSRADARRYFRHKETFFDSQNREFAPGSPRYRSGFCNESRQR